jgi:PAS domain S-box-containing protein
MKKNGFSDRLKALLKQKGLTLAQVATGVGTSVPSVHRWSHGGEIEYENLRALADFLEVNWIWLRYGDDALISAQAALPDNGAMSDLRREYLSQIMESEARMKASLEMAQIVNWEWNVLTGVLTFTPNAADVFGQSPEELRGQLVPFETLGLEDLIRQFEGEQPYKWDFSLQASQDEVTRWFASRGKLLFDSLRRPQKVVAVSVDITARKQAEQALERSEYMLRKIIETIPVGLWAADEQGRICLSNPEVERIWGGAKFVGLEHYGEYKGWWEDTGKEVGHNGWTLARAVQDGETSEAEIVNIEAFDGQRRTIIMYATPLLDAQNRIIGAIEVNQDITLIKQAERSLQQSLEELELLFEQPLFGVVYFNEEKGIVRANRYLCSLVNDVPDELIGKPIDALFDDSTNLQLHTKLQSLGNDGPATFKMTGKLKKNRKGLDSEAETNVELYLLHVARVRELTQTIAFVISR